MAPIIMREVVEVPAGRYSGTIISASIDPSKPKNGGKSYDYLNLRIDTGRRDVKGWDGITKCGVSANLSKLTDLGRMLTRLGLEVPVNQSFDEAVLKGLRINFDMVREGNFTNVDTDTITIAK